MKRFIETIKLSLTSRAFYQRVLKGSEPMGFRYFFWLNTVYSVVIALLFIPTVLLLTSPKAHEEFLSVIPSDLTVTLDKGKTSINLPEPYIIPSKETTDNKCNGDAKCISRKIPTNAVVIDTKTPFSLEQFESYDTTILIKENMIVGRKSGGQIEIIQNPKDVQLTLNREWAFNLITKYAWLSWFIPLGILIASMTVLYALNLLGYLIWALIAWAILRVYGIKTTFGRSYSIILYASVLFMILDLLSIILIFTKSNWFQFFAIAVFLYIVFKEGNVVATAQPESVQFKEHKEIESPATQTHEEAVPAERITDEDKNNGVK